MTSSESLAKDIISSCSDGEFRTMFEHIWPSFISAPASTMLKYHNAKIGGLLEHTLEVYRIYKEIDFDTTPEDSIIKICFSHDIGKACDYYVRETSQWHREKLGKYYSVNQNLTIDDHKNLSLWILSSHRVTLNANEYHAMLYHHGDDRSKLNEHMTLNLFYADMYASHINRI